MSPEKLKYQDLLKREYESRCARNARYSLRAYARDLGLSAPSLSLILNGRQGISAESAAKIAERMGWNPSEREYFCDLVGSLHSRSPAQKKLAKIRLRKHEEADSNLSLDAFQAMSDWYHFAILELTMIEGFKSDVAWIARTLGIPEKAAKLAIERLKRLELLEDARGKLRQTEGFMATPSGVPSDALKKFHQQILAKAASAIQTQPVPLRDFSAIVLPVNTDDLAWAKDRIKEFRRDLMKRLEANERKNEVYCFAVQLFSLSEGVKS